MICMSIATRRLLEYKSSLTVMSIIKIVSVSVNYNFGNTSLEYIYLKIAQIYYSIPYWHKDNFKSVVITVYYWTKRNSK